jgi:hypothetical protein
VPSARRPVPAHALLVRRERAAPRAALAHGRLPALGSPGTGRAPVAGAEAAAEEEDGEDAEDERDDAADGDADDAADVVCEGAATRDQ